MSRQDVGSETFEHWMQRGEDREAAFKWIMEEEDLEPKTLRVNPLEFSTLLVEALNEFIEELEGEIDESLQIWKRYELDDAEAEQAANSALLPPLQEERDKIFQEK